MRTNIYHISTHIHNLSILPIPPSPLKIPAAYVSSYTHIQISHIRPHSIIRKYNLHWHTQRVIHNSNVFVSVIFRFFRFLQNLSFSIWWLSFIRHHETYGHRQASILLYIYIYIYKLNSWREFVLLVSSLLSGHKILPFFSCRTSYTLR